MNSAKESADIRPESATERFAEKGPDMERRRRQSSSEDRDRAKNDDNNNIESATDSERCLRTADHDDEFDVAADRDDNLHRIVKCPSRTADADDVHEDEAAKGAAHPQRSRADAAQQELEEKVGEAANIESLSKTLHINDEIINIIANSKSLLVNGGESVSEEVAAKNERVSRRDVAISRRSPLVA